MDGLRPVHRGWNQFILGRFRPTFRLVLHVEYLQCKSRRIKVYCIKSGECVSWSVAGNVCELSVGGPMDAVTNRNKFNEENKPTHKCHCVPAGSATGIVNVPRVKKLRRCLLEAGLHLTLLSSSSKNERLWFYYFSPTVNIRSKQSSQGVELCSCYNLQASQF